MTNDIDRYRTDCFAFDILEGAYICDALKDFYSRTASDRCKDCPFYRESSQFEYDKKVEEYL